MSIEGLKLPPLNAGNTQAVGAQGDNIVVLMPRQRMTRAEALAHAAWLVALAGGRDAFLPVLDAVEGL